MLAIASWIRQTDPLLDISTSVLSSSETIATTETKLDWFVCLVVTFVWFKLIFSPLSCVVRTLLLREGANQDTS